MKKGQTWTIDFTLSLLLFLAALGAVIYLRAASPAKGFDEINRDSEGILDILLSEGYPASWSQDDIITPGIIYDNRLSMRKMIELENIGYAKYRKMLPFFSNFYILLKKNNSIMPIRDMCGLGSPAVSVQKNTSASLLPAALYSREGSVLEGSVDAEVFSGIELRELMRNLDEYDVIVFDNAKISEGGYMDVEAVKMLLEDYASRYKRFILIGDFGANVFGTNFSQVSSTEGVVVSDAFGFKKGMQINFSQAFAINREAHSIVNNSEGVLAARWIFGDSEIYYFSSSEGSADGEALSPIIEDMIISLSQEETAECNGVTLPDAEDIINIKRVVVYRSDIVQVEAYFWK